MRLTWRCHGPSSADHCVPQGAAGQTACRHRRSVHRQPSLLLQLPPPSAADLGSNFTLCTVPCGWGFDTSAVYNVSQKKKNNWKLVKITCQLRIWLFMITQTSFSLCGFKHLTQAFAPLALPLSQLIMCYFYFLTPTSFSPHPFGFTLNRIFFPKSLLPELKDRSMNPPLRCRNNLTCFTFMVWAELP